MPKYVITSPLVRELGLDKFPVGSEHDISKLRRKCQKIGKRSVLDEVLQKVDEGDPIANLYFSRLHHKAECAREALETMKKRWAGKSNIGVEDIQRGYAPFRRAWAVGFGTWEGPRCLGVQVSRYLGA